MLTNQKFTKRMVIKMNNILLILILSIINSATIIFGVGYLVTMDKRKQKFILLQKQIEDTRFGASNADAAIYARLKKVHYDKTPLKIKIFNFFQKIIMEIKYKMNLK